MNNKKLIIHGGLHKTGTTFMQQSVFPYWEGISFGSFESMNYTLRKVEDKTLLISNEGYFGSPWYPWRVHGAQGWSEHRTRCLAGLHQIMLVDGLILSLRRHSGLISSLYCQYVQQGGFLKFEDFFDIKDDSGFIKRSDLRFMQIIEELQSRFNIHPFVYFMEEIRDGFVTLLSDLERMIGGRAPSVEQIQSEAKNESLGHYQLVAMRFINKYSKSMLNPERALPLHDARLAKFGLDLRSIFQNNLRFISRKKFELDVVLARNIDSYYKEDWDAVNNYSRIIRGELS